MNIAVRADNLFEVISLLESYLIKVDQGLKGTLGPAVFRNKLNHVLNNGLQESVGTLANHAVGVQIKEQLHSFSD